MQRALMVMMVLLFVFGYARAQDPAKVAPKQCKVAFENEYVRVLHWTVAPQEKTAIHDHPSTVTITFAGNKTRYTFADGKTRDVENKPGAVTWSDAVKHSSQNVGDKAGDLVQVELKKKPDAAMTAIPAAEDAVTVDPKHYKVEFQNDRVRVIRIQYGPGEKSMMHSHPASVAVYMTDGQAKMTLPDGKSSVRAIKAGQVQWSGKEKHLPENVGGKPFEVILVELK